MPNKKDSLDVIISKFERKQRTLIEKTMAQIMKLFDDRVTGIAFVYAKRQLISNTFLPKDIKQAIDRLTNTVNAKVRDIIINSIRLSFINSNEKNNEIQAKVASAGRRVPPGTAIKIALGLNPKDNNELRTAVNAFIKRKTKGLGLSKQIWKLSPSFKKAVNDTMIEGLKKGTPARELAKDLRKNLRNDDFIEKPGKGVYGSPQKNAQRVARNEINIAYANADYERWQTEWFIIGIEVKLSLRHPVFDICDSMKGKYPKDFHFILWHPNCLCIAIPLLAPREIRDQYMDFKLGLRDSPPDVPYIKTIPPAAISWMNKNAERVNGWKNKPYWLAANKSKVGKYFN